MKKTASSRLFFNMTILLGIGYLLVSSIIVFAQFAYFSDYAEHTRQVFLNAQKEIMKNEIYRIVQNIKFRKRVLAENSSLNQQIDYEQLKQEFIYNIQQLNDSKVNNYIFICDYQGNFLLNPSIPLYGNFPDSSTQHTMQDSVNHEISDILKNKDGGFINYQWVKPTTRKIADKIAFIYGIPDWNWIIGSGAYLDDLEQNIQLQKKAMGKILARQLTLIFILMFLVLFLGIFLTKKFANTLAKSFDFFLSLLQQAETENHTIDSSRLYYKEFSLLAEKTNTILEEKNQFFLEIQENAKRLNYALEAAADGFWDWDLVKSKVYFSPRIYTMLDYSPQDFAATPDNYFKLIHPEDAGYLLKLTNDNAITAYHIEYRMKAKNGEYRWILSRGKTIDSTKDGKPMRRIGTNTDITERKKTIIRLQESENRYHSLFENSLEGKLVLDESGFVDCNQAALSLLGFAGKEDFFRTPLLCIAENSNDFWQPLLEKIRFSSQGRVVKFKWHGKKTDTSQFVAETFIVPIIMDDVRHFHITFIDITERENYQEALEKNRLFLENILNGLDEGIFTLTYFETLSLEKANCNAALYYFGDYDYPEGTVISELKSEKTKNLEFQALHAISTHSAVSYEESYDHKYYLIKLVPFFSREDYVRLFCTITDLTSQKKIEIAYLKSEQRFKTIFQDVKAGLVLYFPKGKKIMANNAFLSILGYTSQELDNLGIKGITHPDDYAKDSQYIRNLMANKTDNYTTVKRYLAKSGEYVLCYLVMSSSNDPITEQPMLISVIEKFPCEAKDALLNRDTASEIKN